MVKAVIPTTKPKVSAGDPRVYFAAERTLLAWVRSGLAVMALGLVIDKFGLLLSMLATSAGAQIQHHQDPSHYLGIILVLVGMLIVLGAQYNHQFYLSTLPPQDIPQQAIPKLSWFLSLSVVIVGLLLASYLIFA
jgi:putative membrane protein